MESFFKKGDTVKWSDYSVDEYGSVETNGMGTVDSIDENHIIVKWDDGRILAVNENEIDLA